MALREFDSFILIPSLASGDVMPYDDYLGKDSSLYPEMVLLYIDGASACFVHDATEPEIATIELLENGGDPVAGHIQEALYCVSNSFLLKQNCNVRSVNVLPEQKGNFHTLEFKIASPDGDLKLKVDGHLFE